MFAADRASPSAREPAPAGPLDVPITETYRWNRFLLTARTVRTMTSMRIVTSVTPTRRSPSTVVDGSPTGVAPPHHDCIDALVRIGDHAHEIAHLHGRHRRGRPPVLTSACGSDDGALRQRSRPRWRRRPPATASATCRCPSSPPRSRTPPTAAAEAAGEPVELPAEDDRLHLLRRGHPDLRPADAGHAERRGRARAGSSRSATAQSTPQGQLTCATNFVNTGVDAILTNGMPQSAIAPALTQAETRPASR